MQTFTNGRHHVRLDGEGTGLGLNHQSWIKRRNYDGATRGGGGGRTWLGRPFHYLLLHCTRLSYLAILNAFNKQTIWIWHWVLSNITHSVTEFLLTYIRVFLYNMLHHTKVVNIRYDWYHTRPENGSTIFKVLLTLLLDKFVSKVLKSWLDTKRWHLPWTPNISSFSVN